METMYLVIVAFLLCLAIFDLFVGVSNDAVNFLNSAIGAKVAKFRTVLIVASAGVAIGAVMSSGMMDVARHGIMQPSNFSFYDVMTIFLAVMATDVIILDIFNTLGMPTSTTVSLVFELLGGTFILAAIKIAGPIALIRRPTQHRQGIERHRSNLCQRSHCIRVRYRCTVALTYRVHIQLPQAFTLVDSHFRRYRLHSPFLLHLPQGPGQVAAYS